MSSTTYDAVESLVEEINDYYPQSPDFVSAACWADDLKSSNAVQEAVSHTLGGWGLSSAARISRYRAPCGGCLPPFRAP